MPLSLNFQQTKASFFDKAVLARVELAHAKLQAKFGAFARRTMKSSIKYKVKGVSQPGDPPFARRTTAKFTKEVKDKKTGGTKRQSQSPLRELIFFARDPATNSVVIGPVAFGQKGAGKLERGGLSFTRDEKGKRRGVYIKARPFAAPAGEKEAKKLPDLLRGMVK